jgi:hypothetical protein
MAAMKPMYALVVKERYLDTLEKLSMDRVRLSFVSHQHWAHPDQPKTLETKIKEIIRVKLSVVSHS